MNFVHPESGKISLILLQNLLWVTLVAVVTQEENTM